MMGLWKRASARSARSLMHTERVWLPRLTKVSLPHQQLTLSVCISHFSGRLGAQENPPNETPQVAAGENPLWKKFLNRPANLAVLGRLTLAKVASTQEWGVKPGVGTRLSLGRLDNPAPEFTDTASGGSDAASPAAPLFHSQPTRNCTWSVCHASGELTLRQPQSSYGIVEATGNRSDHTPRIGEKVQARSDRASGTVRAKHRDSDR